MCNPQSISFVKPVSTSPRVIRLTAALFFPIGLLTLISFLAGCFVRLAHLPLMHETLANSDKCLVDGMFEGDPSSSDAAIVARDKNSTMASGQHLTIDVETHHKLNEAALKDTVQKLEQVVQYQSDQLLNFSNICNDNSCLSISLDGHIAIYSMHNFVTIDIHIRDYNYTSQYQQQWIQSILTASSNILNGAIRQWSHKLRGFRNSLKYVRNANPLDHELGLDVLRRLDDKRLLVSAKTKFQHVDIYELPRRRFNGDAALAQTFGDELHHPGGLLGKDRALYLDGVLQSSFYGDSAYHEALVHPGMISHGNPRRVAVIGGGEGATLREVLKHKTVEKVVMLEIDEELTELSRLHLTEWSDCSDLCGSRVNLTQNSASCFDDERVDLQFVDAFQWFVDNYSEASASSNNAKTSSEHGLFDVIIMDALDPDDFVEFAEKLYNNTAFIESLYNGLSSEGVFVVQLGASPDVEDPADENGAFRNRANMIGKLQMLGFESIHIYEESHCDFYHPWSILVAFKDYGTRSNWYRNAAEIQLELHQRIHKTHLGTSTALLHVDAATVVSYQLPSKAFESIYCRQDDEPEECDEYYGFWPGIHNVPISEINVQKSGVSEHAGRGIFAINDIPQESMIDLEQSTKSFHMAPTTWDVFDTLYDWVEESDERAGIESKMSGLKYFIEGVYWRLLMQCDDNFISYSLNTCHRLRVCMSIDGKTLTSLLIYFRQPNLTNVLILVNQG
jgi:spermidine synthase